MLTRVLFYAKMDLLLAIIQAVIGLKWRRDFVLAFVENGRLYNATELLQSCLKRC